MLKNPNYVYGSRNLEIRANINFGDFFLDKMWTHRNKIAMINGATDERLTYGDIAQQSMNFAISLTRMGVKKGDVIGIFTENRSEFWGAISGVACSGAVLTTFNPAYVKGELIHVLEISKPSIIICSPTVYKNHGNILKTLPFLKKIILFGDERQPDVIMYNDLTLERNNMIKNVKYEEFQSVEVQGQTDTLFILYSSGTTGLPKGVMLTHLNVICSCCLPPAQNPKEMLLTITPWYHVMGLVGTLTGLVIGRTAVYLAKFEVELYLKTIEKYKITQLVVVPPILVALCKYPIKYDVSSVTIIYSGAAPLHKDTADAARKKFPNVKSVAQGYGATEVTLAVIRHIHEDGTAKTGSVGKIVLSTVIKVVDLNSREPLGPNKPGEICVKGEMLMKGYVGKDNNDYFDDEGFYKTGDVGYYDDDGQFYIVDRLKELIKYKGYQVPPAELEAVLLQNPSIKDVGVIGVEDKTAGEVPLAFVVIQPGKQITEKEIQDFVAERLSNPKHLRGGVRFVSQIPKSPSGKLLRKELKKMLTSVKSHL